MIYRHKTTSSQGLRKGGFRGYIVLGLRRPGRVQVAALSFGPNLSEGPKWSEDLFSLSLNFGQYLGSNLSKDLFVFFAVHLILGKIWYQV